MIKTSVLLAEGEEVMRYALVLLLGLLVGCSTPTPYKMKNKTHPEGISVSSHGDDIYEIIVTANTSTISRRIRAYISLKTAQLCKEKGYSFYDVSSAIVTEEFYSYKTDWKKYNAFGFCYKNASRKAINILFAAKTNVLEVERINTLSSSLKVGDIVTSFEGEKVNNIPKLKFLIHRYVQANPKKDDVGLKILRDNKELSIKHTLSTTSLVKSVNDLGRYGEYAK